MRKWYSIGQKRQYVRVGMPEEEKTEFAEKILEKATASVFSRIESVRLLYLLHNCQI